MVVKLHLLNDKLIMLKLYEPGNSEVTGVL